MTQDKQAKRAARELAAREGISYAAARRRLDTPYEPGEEHYDYIGACAAVCRSLGLDVIDDVDWPEYRQGTLEIAHDDLGPVAAASPWTPEAIGASVGVGCALAWSETRGWWIVWWRHDGYDDDPTLSGRLRDLETELIPTPTAVAAACRAVVSEGSAAWHIGDIDHMRDPARESVRELREFDAALRDAARAD